MKVKIHISHFVETEYLPDIDKAMRQRDICHAYLLQPKYKRFTFFDGWGKQHSILHVLNCEMGMIKIPM